MKKQNSPNKKTKQVSKKPVSQPTAVKAADKPTVFVQFEKFAEKNHKWLFGIVIFISVLCSIALFDLKVSTGGDDSAYILRAFRFLKDGDYPYYQGPGYPVMLSILMKIFGYKIGVFKVFSLLFYTAHVAITWLTFRRRLPYLIVVFMVGFAVVSDFMQYYASQTWSEAFYLFLQSIVLWICMKAVDIKYEKKSIAAELKSKWYIWLGIGLIFVLSSMTKTVAIFGILAPVVFFVIQRKYRFAIYVVISFALWKVAISQTEKAFFGPNDTAQWDQMMLKDGYHPELGKLDAFGFFERFGLNLKTYSSMQFFRIVHILPQNKYYLSEDGTNLEDENSKGWMVTILMTALFVLCSIKIYKANKQAFFLVLYTAIMCGGIFFGIHANNRQDRLIIILFPFLLTILGYGGYLLAKNMRILQTIVIGILSITLLASFYHMAAKAPESLAALQKNMGNQPYYGYTTDWVNYFEMSEWCSKNLPESSMVACRKPEMSFIATGKEIWYGVRVVESQDADFWLQKFSEAKVTHMLIADLRAIPFKKSNRIISTLHKVASFILQKYPKKLVLVKTIGTDERSYLYEFRYND